MSITAGAAAIMGGSALLSNIFGKKSQDSANAANYKIAQMNNEWSEKMMQKQMDYNTEMWNKQNEYNSPSEQRKRLESAGINPALALSNIQTGQAQSASAPSLPSPSSATMQPYRYDFSGVGNALSSAYQLSLAESKNAAEINNLNAQADVARARAAADNAWTYEKLKETKVGRMFLEQTFDIRKNQLNADYHNTIRAGRQQEENIKLTISQGLLAQKELAIFDAQRAAGIANTIADTLLKGAQKQLTKQQMIHEVQKMYKSAAEAQGLKLSNDILKRSANDIVEKAHKDNASTYWNVGANYLGNIVDGFLGFGLGRVGKVMDKAKPIKGFGR